jgi:hypothetical protein
MQSLWSFWHDKTHWRNCQKGVDWVVVARCGTRSISLGANPLARQVTLLQLRFSPSWTLVRRSVVARAAV